MLSEGHIYEGGRCEGRQNGQGDLGQVAKYEYLIYLKSPSRSPTSAAVTRMRYRKFLVRLRVYV